nr:hypothetical protein [Tanacetum cinerariifolium]
MEPKHVEISCESVLPALSPKQPWFVAQNLEGEGDDTQVDIFYNIHDPLSHYRCQIPELHGNRVRGCFHGCWVVLSSNHPRDVNWSLWNPVTSKIINLPPLKYRESKGCYDECCLSAPPEDPNSVLLLMRTAKHNFVFCRLGIDSSSPDACNRHELKWTNSTYANQIKILIDCYDGSLCCLTCCNGKVYACIKLFGHRGRARLIVEVNIATNDYESKKQKIEDLKETVLSVELNDGSPMFYSPAIASSEFGGYIHILADDEKIIYSYHVKDKTISFSSIPCVAGTNHVSAWAILECTRLKSDETHDESHLFNLPPHVLENLVMEFCAGVDYLKFRATCKRCHLAAPLVPWNNGKASKIMLNYSLPSPWLIVFNKYKGIMTLTDPMFGDKYFMKSPQELICDFQIKCSRFGWLLILKSDGSLVFFNPFTNDILKLRELPGKHIGAVCFSAPPTSPDCMVVGIILGFWHACIHIVGGEPSRRSNVLYIRGNAYFTSITFYGRDLYALKEDGGFDVFEEMGRENHKWWRDVAKAPASCCSSLSECFHLRCDQHNLRVIVGKFGESVEVFKLSSSNEWDKVVGLGFHTLNNEDSFGDFFGTKHYLSSHGWIEPRWS